MIDTKKPHSQEAQQKISEQSVHALADELRNKETSEQKNYAKLDKGRDAEVIHTNGSTPKNRL